MGKTKEEDAVEVEDYPEKKFFEGRDELCRWVRRISGDTVLLSFSLGKDSMSAWLILRKYFCRVIPVHFDYMPHELGFLNRACDHYEKQFGEKIIRFPHPWVYETLQTRLFQPPWRARVLEEVCQSLAWYDSDDLLMGLKADLGLYEDTFCANGVRGFDNQIRRMHFATNGPINYRRRMFSPAYDVSRKELIELFRENDVKLSENYHAFGRSFEGLSARYILPLAEHFPDDYEKLRELFPLLDVVLIRDQLAAKYRRLEEEAKKVGIKVEMPEEIEVDDDEPLDNEEGEAE